MATTVTNPISTKPSWKQQFGVPQFVAAAMLLFFLAQCAFFISHVPLNQVEANYVMRGLSALRRVDTGLDPQRPPLTALLSVAGIAPFAGGPSVDQFWLDQHRWLIRLPFLGAGLLLGASLWYVARRLFANQGGYIALGIYCFSPGIVARSSLAGPEILGAWGAFGLIFTAIATAHTLYAPREVILWNWKRIVLLGVSIGLTVGAQWSLAIVLIPAVLFMFWAVPERRGAAAVIVLAACFVALLLLDISYLGNLKAFAAGLAPSRGPLFAPEMLARSRMYSLVPRYYLDASPATVIVVIVALATFIAWRRTRFFGNAAPLIIAALLALCAFVVPVAAGPTYFFYALPFLILFAAGVFADLLESKRPSTPAGLAYGAILAQAVYSVVGLMRVFSRGM